MLRAAAQHTEPCVARHALFGLSSHADQHALSTALHLRKNHTSRHARASTRRHRRRRGRQIEITLMPTADKKKLPAQTRSVKTKATHPDPNPTSWNATQPQPAPKSKKKKRGLPDFPLDFRTTPALPQSWWTTACHPNERDEFIALAKRRNAEMLAASATWRQLGHLHTIGEVS